MDRIAAFQKEITLDAVARTPIPPEAPAPARARPAVATASTPATVTPASFSDSVATAPPQAQPAAAIQKSTSNWTYSLEPGQGLPLLVGDIGVVNEAITIVKPDGVVDRLTSGSKPEFGLGGFETYANVPGTYKIQFLGQSFDIPLSGQQFTKVSFNRIADPSSVQVNINFRNGLNTYAVREKVFVSIVVTNLSNEPVPFGILGLLTDPGHFQTSWDNGLISPGDTFQHEDGLVFDAPGTYKIQLSICFAKKEDCFGTDEGWARFEPGLEVVVE